MHVRKFVTQPKHATGSDVEMLTQTFIFIYTICFEMQSNCDNANVCWSFMHDDHVFVSKKDISKIICIWLNGGHGCGAKKLVNRLTSTEPQRPVDVKRGRSEYVDGAYFPFVNKRCHF